MIDLSFILERYNYWIFIILMMIGLYTVISRGNLVKKIVGLNIFQTSVFIYYISIGKIRGGTAPILLGGHGEEHGDAPGDSHGAGATGHGAEGAPIHAEPANSPESMEANDLGASVRERALEASGPVHADPSLHGTPDGAEANPADRLGANDFARTPPETNDALVAQTPETPDLHFEVAPPDASGAHGSDAISGVVDLLNQQATDIIYTNPLPHVLILTAIVVGVATTAVGLALAVRIREAYGTIEEDELEAADEIAEFGHAAPGARA